MFSYVDPGIADLLAQRGKLIHVDQQGRPLPGVPGGAPSPGTHLTLVGPVPLPISLPHDGGSVEHDFSWYAFVRRVELRAILEAAEAVRESPERDLRPLLTTFMAVSSILVCGDFAAAEAPLVRLHSCCMTSDVFGSMRCECGPQLRESLARIAEEGVGAVVYLASHEGRGIGLWAKAITYLLQDMGHDTYQANVALGLPEDSRDFGDAAVALRVFRPDGGDIRLLTNNPLKVADLERGGMTVREALPLVTGITRFNRRYLQAKQAKGHAIPPGTLDEG